MTGPDDDERWVRRALELAQRGAADEFTAAWRASGLGIDCAEVTTGRPRPRSGRAWP